MSRRGSRFYRVPKDVVGQMELRGAVLYARAALAHLERAAARYYLGGVNFRVAMAEATDPNIYPPIAWIYPDPPPGVFPRASFIQLFRESIQSQRLRVKAAERAAGIVAGVAEEPIAAGDLLTTSARPAGAAPGFTVCRPSPEIRRR